MTKNALTADAKDELLSALAARPADAELLHRSMVLTAGRIDKAIELAALKAKGASRGDVHAFIERCRQSEPTSLQELVDSVCKPLGLTASTDGERLQALQVAMTHENTVALRQVMKRLEELNSRGASVGVAEGTLGAFAAGVVLGVVAGK